MTAIEDTLPAVSVDAPRDLVDAITAEVQEMNSDGWAVFEENGVGEAQAVQVSFAFSAPTEEAADELAESLEEADYEVRAIPPGTEFDEWAVEGTTPEVTVTAEGVDEWVRRMAATGIERGCQLDGWSALLG